MVLGTGLTEGMGLMTTGLQADTLGPVDVAVILFEGNKFNGDVAPSIIELVEQGTVRVIDMALVTKAEDGTTGFVEVEDAEIAEAFGRIGDAQLDLLSDEDLAAAAEDLPANSSALVIVWENVWLGRLGAAIRGSHGQVVALERIPREEVLRAVAALEME